MPPKTDSRSETTPSKNAGATKCCILSPGPKYQLKTLVGFPDHCISRYRNPAYSFGSRLRSYQGSIGPGPKYLLQGPKGIGFSFGTRLKSINVCRSPGPKYVLPVPKSPAFSIKFRTKQRLGCVTPGPYNVKPPKAGPAFFMGIRLPNPKCNPVPGPRSYSVDLVTQKAPVYSIAHRQNQKILCRSPGPKYHPKIPKVMPMYSFGVKHHECAPPYIVECDDQC